MSHFDVAIVGAGIAGASLASAIADEQSVLLLEAEDAPGYHATGRSAAFWTETYGGPDVQPLTTASGAFLHNPPAHMSEQPFLKRRGALNIATRDQTGRLDHFVDKFAGSGVAMERIGREAMLGYVPDLGSQWAEAVYEADCMDIDVAALHQAYLADAKRKGVCLSTRASLNKADWRDGRWTIETQRGRFTCDILVNAAGAWADPVAKSCGVEPLEIAPKRRTMVQIRTDPPSRANMPLVVAIDGSFYFKPEGDGRYWVSPHDEIDDRPGDAAPEEIDIAVAVDRFEQAMDAKILAVERKWAGLRSFAPDRLPVIGRDPRNPHFFWFVGQGGWGIQTAPAAAALAAQILRGISDPALANIDVRRYDPARFV